MCCNKQYSVWYPDVPIFSVTGNCFFYILVWNSGAAGLCPARCYATAFVSSSVTLLLVMDSFVVAWWCSAYDTGLQRSRVRVVNNQIKRFIAESEWHFFKSVNIWQICKQERGSLVHFLRLLAVCWPGAQSAWDNHALACNFAKYSLILFFFHLQTYLIICSYTIS